MRAYSRARHTCFQCCTLSSKMAPVFSPGTRPSAQRPPLLTVAQPPPRTSHVHLFIVQREWWMVLGGVGWSGGPGRAGQWPCLPPGPALLHLSRWTAKHGVLFSVPSVWWRGYSRKPEVSWLCPFSEWVPTALMECPLTHTGLLRFPHQQK